jgi:hypothetical protein
LLESQFNALKMTEMKVTILLILKAERILEYFRDFCWCHLLIYSSFPNTTLAFGEKWVNPGSYIQLAGLLVSTAL